MGDFQSVGGETPGSLPGGNTGKRAWHRPTLEEVDYTATEAGGADVPDGLYDNLSI